MKTKELTRKLRKEQTPQEKILWELLRNRQICGKKFLRQYPIKFNLDEGERFFIADFYCSENKLVIELDGRVHENTKEYDKLRDSLISLKKIKVIRFTNDEIEQNINKILKKIKNELIP
ncbi:MAG: endonuclease domain-containing protein [Candidatus Sericytochromatia bacterium]